VVITAFYPPFCFIVGGLTAQELTNQLMTLFKIYSKLITL